ncbi:MAG TPA: 2-amino-4-hydroxy-6-hydroxymethyldihydropteridine diphosphokinase [Candidatus Cloacimonetes bacterium]|nr:2-amino-4-hydroxy-6-hydroxymethyldihydropteridine diphosphokinase [Candidatus Cloacimonadota bacterium]
MGSNLGNKRHFIESAISALRNEKKISVKRISSIIETIPIGNVHQPDFLNCIVECDTEMSSHELMQTLLNIEKKLGRERNEKWGPRTIDLDILFFDDEITDTDVLKIPHPEIMNRPFILQLMNELAPEFLHPKLNQTMEQLYGRN